MLICDQLLVDFGFLLEFSCVRERTPSGGEVGENRATIRPAYVNRCTSPSAGPTQNQMINVFPFSSCLLNQHLLYSISAIFASEL